MTSGSVLDLINLYQPSVMKLAKEGNPQAIALWVNTRLVPQGIYARVEAEQPGQFLMVIEFQRQPERDRLVRFICHRLHRLESSVIQQVRIVAQPVGSTVVSWQQSVRLSASPASHTAKPSEQALRPKPPTTFAAELESAWSLPAWSWPKWVRQWTQPQGARLTVAPFKYGRPLMMGSAIAFVIGCGFQTVSYHTDWLEYGLTAVRPFDANAPKDWIKGAFGDVPVRQVKPLQTSTSPGATLVFSTDAVLEGDSAAPGEAELLPEDLAAFREADLAFTSINRPVVGDRISDQGAIPLDRLRAIGVDLVSVGTDARGQAVGRSISDTLKMLRQVDIRPVGLGRSQREARRPEIFEVQGQRIAYLSYSDALIELERPSQGTAEIERQIQEDIGAIRSQVQWVVINFRWGHELAEYPADWQMQIARHAVDQGADLVVGQHASVMQGAELYNGRAIAYSLGNLIFADTETAHENYESAMLRVSLQDDEMRIEFLPVQVRNRQPRIVSRETGEAILRYIQQASALFREPLQAPVVLRGRTVERPETNGLPALLPTTEGRPDDALELEPDARETSSSESFVSYPDDSNTAEIAPVDDSESTYTPDDESESFGPAVDSADDSFISEP